MKESDNSKALYKQGESASRSIAEKLRVVAELRDLQEKLAPLRAANKVERSAGKVKIRIKTK